MAHNRPALTALRVSNWAGVASLGLRPIGRRSARITNGFAGATAGGATFVGFRLTLDCIEKRPFCRGRQPTNALKIIRPQPQKQTSALPKQSRPVLLPPPQSPAPLNRTQATRPYSFFQGQKQPQIFGSQRRAEVLGDREYGKRPKTTQIGQRADAHGPQNLSQGVAQPRQGFIFIHSKPQSPPTNWARLLLSTLASASPFPGNKRSRQKLSAALPSKGTQPAFVARAVLMLVQGRKNACSFASGATPSRPSSPCVFRHENRRREQGKKPPQTLGANSIPRPFKPPPKNSLKRSTNPIPRDKDVSG